MEDIQSKISQIMSDPEAMKQMQGLGEMLGLSGNSTEAPTPKPKEPAQDDIMSLLGAEGMSGITKLLPVLSSMNQEDETTHLLHALRPFLSEEKRKRLDEAKKMIQLLKILPMLKNNGLF